MADHTPEPCGCRIDPVAGAWRIDYCPTHAAAFETAEKLRVKEGLLEAALEKPMRDAVTIADLLAALKPFVRDELPEGDEYADPWLVGVSDAELQAARTAITAATQGEACPECGGSKYVDVEPPGTGLVKCPRCKGTGAATQGEVDLEASEVVHATIYKPATPQGEET